MSRIQRHLFSPAALATVVVATAGCVAVYSSSAGQPGVSPLIFRQLVWLLVGIALMLLFACQTPDELIRRAPFTTVIAGIFLGLAVASQLFTSLPAPVETLGGGIARANIAELARPLFVIALARWCPSQHHDQQPPLRSYLIYLLLAGVWVLPALLLRSLGLVILYSSTALLLHWLQGGAARRTLVTVGAVAAVLIVVSIAKPSIWRSDSRPQGSPAAASFAEGGWIGGPGFWGQNFNSSSQSPRMFRRLVETFGSIGGLFFIGLVIAWLVYGMLAAQGEPSLPRSMLLAGATALLGLQAIFHVSATLGLVSGIDLALPLPSDNGCTIAATMATVGIVLAFASHARAEAAKQSEVQTAPSE